MVTEEILQFHDRHSDLDLLAGRILRALKESGFSAQSIASPIGTVIQARKGGVLHDVISAGRAFSIVIDGKPDDFRVRVGIGRWIRNIASVAVDTPSRAALFLAVDVPELLWREHVELNLLRMITRLVDLPPPG